MFPILYADAFFQTIDLTILASAETILYFLRSSDDTNTTILLHGKWLAGPVFQTIFQATTATMVTLNRWLTVVVTIREFCPTVSQAIVPTIVLAASKLIIRNFWLADPVTLRDRPSIVPLGVAPKSLTSLVEIMRVAEVFHSLVPSLREVPLSLEHFSSMVKCQSAKVYRCTRVQILSVENLYPIPPLGHCIVEAPTQTAVSPMNPVDIELHYYVSVSTVNGQCYQPLDTPDFPSI
jgi:hypothetical protein